MKYMAFVLVIPFLFFWGVLNAYAGPNKAKTELISSKGENVGIATLVEGTDGVLITIMCGISHRVFMGFIYMKLENVSHLILKRQEDTLIHTEESTGLKTQKGHIAEIRPTC